MAIPDITIRQKDSPYVIVNAVNYFQSKIGSDALPVLQGEQSEPIFFRVYNNFALNSGIEDAINVQVTVYDGVGAGSHSAMSAPASQSWLHVLESGFGESTTVANDPLTNYTGNDTAVGGANTYIPEKGSAGTFGTPTITGLGSKAGFIQLKTYLTPPGNALGDIYNFAICVLYEYI
jgi:hypothetical protein